jgi:LacI family transcriptional regulator
MLAAPDRPRAMFVWSDRDAVQLLNLARPMGLRVPEDLALIGYDNSAVAALPLIGLASMDQDGARLGTIAAEALLTRIGGRQVAEHRVIPAALVPRASF